MAFHLSFSARALREVGAAHDWYAAQVPGLGNEFLAAIALQIERLMQAPLLYAEVVPGVRRALLPRFPYGLFFAVRGHRVQVLAVLHQARDQQTWPAARTGEDS